MQGPTHQAGGVTAALAGYVYLSSLNSPLITNAPLASLAIIYPFALWGSKAPDLDHSPGGVWDEVRLVGKRSGNSIPFQDPISRLISHILHLTKPLRGIFPKKSMVAGVVSVLDCKHRSWQTHSELPIVSCGYLFYWLSTLPLVTVETVIFQLILIGLILGFLAHLVLDLLTPEGLPFASGILVNKLLGHTVLPERIKIIPHIKSKVEGKPGFFSTGGPWEKSVVFNLLHFVNLLLLGYLLYLFLS